MGQFFNSINEVRKNYSKYDAWEQTQADERAQKETLSKTLDIPQDKVELTKEKAKIVIRATEIMDKRSEDNCENMEQLTGLIAMPPLMIVAGGTPLALQSLLNKTIKNTNLKINKLKEQLAQPDISKEARDAALEQIGKLNKKITKLTQRGGIYGQVASILLVLMLGSGFTLWGTAKQKNASRIGRFQAKQDELKDINNFVIYTPEQIKQAQEIAAKIPDEKERNDILKLISELKDLNKDGKAYKEWLKTKDPKEIEKLKARNLTPEQLKIGNEDKELIVDAVKEITIKAEEYSENVENAYDTLGTLSWLFAIPAGFLINSVLKLFKVPKFANRITSIAIPALTSIVLSTMGTFEQKKASRIGRYKARQDLMQNPARLMAYQDEDMAKVKNIKAEKQQQGLFEKIGNNFKFLKTYSQDKKEYNNYRKTEYSQVEKMQKTLNQIEITDNQKKQAEQLQDNVFRAFDEIDEMSQKYSEDVEAGCDIAKQTLSQLWSLGYLGGLGALTYFGIKGKLPISKIANDIINAGFKKDSAIRTGVNNLYNVLKKDKKLMQEFQRALANGHIKYFLSKPKAKEINQAVQELLASVIPEISKAQMTGDKNAVRKVLNAQLKDGSFAKWTRNMIEQIFKLVTRNKVGEQLPKEIVEEMQLNNWKSYKTLIGTGVVAGAPVLGLLFAVPYAFNAWLTNIQKKAGKIGIMKAMERIDDPRVFAPDEILRTESIKQNTPAAVKTTNLLNQLKTAET